MLMKRLVVTVGLLLISVGAAYAQVPGDNTPSTPTVVAAPVDAGVQVVADFLSARSNHDADTCYKLISFVGGNGTLSVKDYKNASADIDAAEKSMPPGSGKLIGALYFLFDVNDVKGYRFDLTAPVKPNVIGVHVTPGPGASDPTPYDIGAIVVVDPVDHHEKIQAWETLLQLSPKVMIAARDKARAVSCMSNLKQIGLGILQYVQDSDMKFPGADKWMDEIDPYLKAAHGVLYKCPGDTHQYSYSFNRALSHISDSAIGHPSDVVVVFESSSGKRNQSDHGSTLIKKSRHGGTVNYCFADGHVASKPDSMPLKIQGKKDLSR